MTARTAAPLPMPSDPMTRGSGDRPRAQRPGALGLAVLALLLLGVAPSECRTRLAAATPDGDLMKGTYKRIEQYRKADALVCVLDANGKPIPNAKVHVQQTRHAFLFGCNIFLWGRAGNEPDEAAYRQRFQALLNYATLPFYWAAYEPRQGQPDHARISQIARWCQAHDIATKGHPLAWNYADPSWLPDDADQVRSLQLARIDDCVSRFRGLIDRWDVINEAAHFQRQSFRTRAPKMTRMWEKTGRIELVRMCLRHARQSSPEATLLINDYRVDEAYDKVLQGLVDQDGKPQFDVIGIQSHMHRGVWTNDKIWQVCERFAKYGVPLHFTETTILSGKPGWAGPAQARQWPSTAEGEQRQARETERFYTLLFSHPAVEAITWWDFSDRRAWQGAPAGFLRQDMSPKPVYDRLMQLIKGQWWTTEELATDAAGQAHFRGFLGQYKITATAPGGSHVQGMTVQRDGPNRVIITLGPAPK